MRLFILLSLIILLILGSPGGSPALAQSQITGLQETYAFGEQITIQAELQSTAPLEHGLLFVQVEGENSTRRFDLAEGLDGTLRHRIDVTAEPVRAFSTLTYWFEVDLSGGEKITSQQRSFFYEDNRFAWQVRQGDTFRVHWYEGDAEFAQDVMDISRSGLRRIQSLLPLEAPEHVDIYVYSTAVEMQATLELANLSWTASGHADPDLGVMVVALPPGPDQRLMMEARVPHELMHILLFQETGAAYTNLPSWLNEGLATNAELYPNPDYLTLMHGAEQKNGLLPMDSLCGTFPRDASSAVLAYAQSASFTRFLHDQHGVSGLEKLVAGYQDGLSCERGVEHALDAGLIQLERQWRWAAFGENAVLSAGNELLPWLVLLLAVLIVPVGLALFGLSRRHLGSRTDSAAGKTS